MNEGRSNEEARVNIPTDGSGAPQFIVAQARADRWMSRGIFRYLNVIGFCFAILLLLVIGVALYRNTQGLIKSARWVAHTQEVLTQLVNTLSAVYDLEAGSRGYALTGATSYLDPVFLSMESVIQYEKKLRGLTADNASQQERLDILEPLVTQRIAITRRTISSREQGGLAAAAEVVTTGDGKGVTESIGKTIRAMTQEEERLLVQRRAEEEASTAAALAWMAVGLILAVLVFVGVYTLLRREISHRRRNELALERSEEENRLLVQTLSAANRELEAFSYSVSHDLRAPLRHISGFLDLFEKSAGESLDQKAGRYLGIIKDSTRQMGVLIDDLLAFARIGRAPLNAGPVPLDAVVAEVISDLAHEASGRDVKWIVKDLPQVQGDRNLLKLAISNLLDNALKYTRPKKTAVIEVRSEHRDDTVVIQVLRQWGGIRSPRRREALWRIPEAAQRIRVRGHGDRAGQRETDREPPRWRDMGGERARQGKHILLLLAREKEVRRCFGWPRRRADLMPMRDARQVEREEGVWIA